MGVENRSYTLVGVDIDTTGRRLIDEIVQLSAYTPGAQFSQYIMPYMNLNPAARQRHQIKVVTIGFYRMLKSTQSYKILKSKSEVATLKDFLDWIENLNKTNSQSNGVILIYHEERKFVPFMLLEAYKRYGLLDRFFETIKSFANGFELARQLSDHNPAIKSFTLRYLSKILLNKNEINSKDNKNYNKNQYFEGNASVRAKLSYELAHKIANGNFQRNLTDSEITSTLDDNLDEKKILKVFTDFCEPVEKDLNELEVQNENLERQTSFRPIFLEYFKTTLYHRVKAVKFRIILAENGYDAENLKTIWNEKRKEGLTEIIQTIKNLKADEKSELIDLLDAHFDPNKQPMKPLMKRTKRRSRRNRNKGKDSKEELKNQSGAGDDKNQPDSTTTAANTAVAAN